MCQPLHPLAIHCPPPLSMASLCVFVSACGNLQCELGEACPESGLPEVALLASAGIDDNTTATPTCCPQDCPTVVRACPVGPLSGLPCDGHGSCLSGAGVCACYHGYAGDACDSCCAQCTSNRDDAGQLLSCTFLPGILSTCTNGVRDGHELGVDCGGVCRMCNTSSSADAVTSTAPTVDKGQLSAVSIISLAASGSGVLLGAAVVALLLLRRRRARRASFSPVCRVQTVWADPVALPRGSVIPRPCDTTDSSGVEVAAVALQTQSQLPLPKGTTRLSAVVKGDTPASPGNSSRVQSPVSVSGGFAGSLTSRRVSNDPDKRQSRVSIEVHGSKVVPLARVVKVQPARDAEDDHDAEKS